MERGREKQPAGDSGREDTPLPTRFGRNKRRPLPRPRLFGRYAGVSTPGRPRSELAVVPAEEREEIAVAVKRGELPCTEVRRSHAGARDVVEHPRGLQFGEQGVDI